MRKLVKAIEELQGQMRFVIAAFVHLKLMERDEQDGQFRHSFVDPETFSALPVLKRGFVGRFKWLFLGK